MKQKNTKILKKQRSESKATHHPNELTMIKTHVGVKTLCQEDSIVSRYQKTKPICMHTCITDDNNSRVRAACEASYNL